MSDAPWDYMDGSTPPPPPPPPPPIVHWGKGDQSPVTPVSAPSLTPNENGNLAPPNVPPQNGGSGTTVVDTASLDTFAANMGRLLTPVEDARAKLVALEPVAAGLFADAQNLEQEVSGIPADSAASSGASASGGKELVSNYIAALKDLADGLTDLQTAAKNMSTKYTSADDLNNMSVTDLQTGMGNSQSDFSNMMTANGGTPATPGTGGSSGSSGSGS